MAADRRSAVDESNRVAAWRRSSPSSRLRAASALGHRRPRAASAPTASAAKARRRCRAAPAAHWAWPCRGAAVRWHPALLLPVGSCRDRDLPVEVALELGRQTRSLLDHQQEPTAGETAPRPPCARGRGRRHERRVGASPIGAVCWTPSFKGAGGGRSDAWRCPCGRVAAPATCDRQVAQGRNRRHEQA